MLDPSCYRYVFDRSSAAKLYHELLTAEGALHSQTRKKPKEALMALLRKVIYRKAFIPRIFSIPGNHLDPARDQSLVHIFICTFDDFNVIAASVLCSQAFIEAKDHRAEVARSMEEARTAVFH